MCRVRVSAFQLVVLLILSRMEVIRMAGKRSFFDGEEKGTTGFDPSNHYYSNPNDLISLLRKKFEPIRGSVGVSQEDADLLYMFTMYERSGNNSKIKREILEEITTTMNHRLHLDSSIDLIGKLIFGSTEASSILRNIRSSGQPLVDDWDCLTSMVRIFETHCGSLKQYGMKHTRAFANLCNWGISMEAMEGACISACGGYNSAKWSPLTDGYSA